MLCKGRLTLFCKKWLCIYRVLADVASFTLPSWFPPSYCLQTRLSDLRGLMFETSMGRTINCISSVPHCTPTTRCLSAQGPSPHGIGRHCSHLHLSAPAPGGGPLSQGLGGLGRSAGADASGHPQLRPEFGDSSGGQRLLCRGEGSLGRVVALLGAILLGGDVGVGR